MLCYLHFGLLVASQAPQVSPKNTDPVESVINEGKQLRDSGQVSASIARFSQAIKLARELNDSAGQAKGLITLASAQTILFQYRSALASLEQATVLADRLHNNRLKGAAKGNIATIYSQVGDLAQADSEAEQAIEFLKQDKQPDGKNSTLLARAFLSHAAICFQLGKNSEGYRDSAEALDLVQGTGNVQLDTQALIWDVRGSALMRENKIDEAGDCLQKAFYLRKRLDDLDGLAVVKEQLAELESKKVHPDTKKALSLIDDAFATPSHSFKLHPQYYPIHIRGKILLEAGNKSAALVEFQRAVSAANEWRMGALPGDATNTYTVAALQAVYADYAQLAAEIALEKNDKVLAANALEVLAENRAASLREQLRRVYTSNFRLPDEYYFKLAQLQSAQAEVTLGRAATEDKAQLTRIRLEITDLENQIGLRPEKFSASGEKIPRRNSLRDIQRTLTRDQVLISITLGESSSYLWAVTGEKVSLSRLPGEGEITSKAESFVSAVRNGHDSSFSSAQLSQALFAGLPPDVWNRSEWMIVADGPLLSGVPFCALPRTGSTSDRRILITSRSLRFLPSELMLLDQPPVPQKQNSNGGFVGIGDPIYNLADARLVHTSFADAKSVSASVSLARLVGSEKEIRSAAKESHSSDAILLSGAKATREDLTAALAHHPAIIHFAVHVVSPPDQPQQAALAISLRNGMPELLTPEVVASFHTPGSLVVLSGCSSGQGKFMPGAGLVGLSRAWLLAGAAAVVVSSWPTPDDSGRFFSSFYGHLDQIHSGDIAQRAALALRLTQLDMLHGSGYQTSPAFWGAFAVISKE